MNGLTDNYPAFPLTGTSQIFHTKEHELLLREQVYQEKLDRHAHVYHEMLYVKQGYGFFCFRQSITLLFPGDLILIWPGVSHSLLQCCELHVIECSFSQQYLRRFERALSGLPLVSKLGMPGTAMHFHGGLRTENPFERLLTTLQEEQGTEAHGWRECMAMHFGQLLVACERAVKDLNFTAPQNMQTLPLVRKIMSVIESSFMEDMDAAQMAEQVGLNVDYMTRAFREVTGITPKECLRFCRMMWAYEQLRTGRYRPSEIAEKLHFPDTASFSRQFKRVIGTSPYHIQ